MVMELIKWTFGRYNVGVPNKVVSECVLDTLCFVTNRIPHGNTLRGKIGHSHEDFKVDRDIKELVQPATCGGAATGIKIQSYSLLFHGEALFPQVAFCPARRLPESPPAGA